MSAARANECLHISLLLSNGFYVIKNDALGNCELCIVTIYFVLVIILVV